MPTRPGRARQVPISRVAYGDSRSLRGKLKTRMARAAAGHPTVATSFDSPSGCQSYSLRVPFTAARLTGATAHHHQRGRRRWQVNHRACTTAVHAVQCRIDAEDIGQTNPCPMDDTFFDLLHRNVAGLVENFWAAGYVNVIAGSFLRRYSDYVSFRQMLRPSAVFLIDLLVDKEMRDHRRITWTKQTTREWRDMVDQITEDRTIRRAADADYRYIGIDTTDLDVGGTVQLIKAAIPEVYAG